MQALQNTGRKTIDRTSQHSLQVNRADTDLRFVHWSGVAVFAHIAKQKKSYIIATIAKYIYIYIYDKAYIHTTSFLCARTSRN